MITIFDRTSDFSVFAKKSRQKVKPSIEKKLKSFAFLITGVILAEQVFDAAEVNGLTLDKRAIGRGSIGDYVTVGVNKNYDVSIVRYRSDIPSGVDVISSVYEIEDKLTYIFHKKADLLLEDIYREKTYRELYTGQHSEPASRKSTKKSLLTPCSCTPNIDIVVSDHYIMANGKLRFKRPNDMLENIIVSNY